MMTTTLPGGSGAFAQGSARGDDARAVAAEARVRTGLTTRLAELGVAWGAPVLLRIFKTEGVLEVWVDDGRRYQHFHTYPICRWSGQLGPKLAEGDMQAPEGYYAVTARALNPLSRYHLSFDLGYPNAYDRSHGRSGNYLMVHGHCVSIGCYAMGDAAIEAIYTLVAAALANGQSAVPVHAYPFRFTAGWEARQQGSQWLEFWTNLAEGDAEFHRHQQPPRVTVRDGRYSFAPTSPR